MGIYYDNNVYGVTIGLDKNILIKMSKSNLTPLEIQEVRDCYKGLTEEEKDKIHIHFYVSCSSTYSVADSTFMTWIAVTKEKLENLF
jgi:hypothetical protein